MKGLVAAPGILLGAVLLSLVFGSIHAFSALMAPLEQALETSRANVSLGYSLAIASLTCGVYASAYLLRLPSSFLALGSGIVAAAGLVLAASGHSLLPFLAGYGIVFGFTNGVAYSLFLNRAAHAMPDAQGWSAGIVTACYGLGAAVFAQGFDAALAFAGVRIVLLGLAASVAVAAAFAAVFFRGGSAQLQVNGSVCAAPRDQRFVTWLWFVYFLGAAGGLMVIAHASGIATSSGLNAMAVGAAPTMVALGNIAGSFAGGPWGERRSARVALVAPLAIAVLSMVLLLATPSAGLFALTLCGAAYGALIAVVPAIIRKTAGNDGFARSFGLVFTAWGIAGLTAPFAAGAMFDAFASYGVAIALALVAASAGIVLAVAGRRASAV